MTLKMVGRILTPPQDPWCTYLAYKMASKIAKDAGADTFYFGTPRREIGEEIGGPDELLYDYKPGIPKTIQDIFHKLFPDPAFNYEWGIYIVS